MIIFPAIDLKDGLCVRLMQGDPDRATVYGRDPVAMAQRWAEEGARWLHVVDLDGAFSKSPKNREAIAAIVKSLSIPVQVGGGIRTLTTVVEYLGLGVRRVILGTAALRDPALVAEACERYPRRVALGIDARAGKVAVEGWKEATDTEVSSLVESYAQSQVAAIIYTDIQRDGMSTGVNVDATRDLLEVTRFPVIASGGVASIEDIQALMPLVPLGLEGVIVGRALYNGNIRLVEALSWVRDHLGHQS